MKTAILGLFLLLSSTPPSLAQSPWPTVEAISSRYQDGAMRLSLALDAYFQVSDIPAENNAKYATKVKSVFVTKANGKRIQNFLIENLQTNFSLPKTTAEKRTEFALASIRNLIETSTLVDGRKALVTAVSGLLLESNINDVTLIDEMARSERDRYWADLFQDIPEDADAGVRQLERLVEIQAANPELPLDQLIDFSYNRLPLIAIADGQTPSTFRFDLLRELLLRSEPQVEVIQFWVVLSGIMIDLRSDRAAIYLQEELAFVNELLSPANLNGHPELFKNMPILISTLRAIGDDAMTGKVLKQALIRVTDFIAGQPTTRPVEPGRALLQLTQALSLVQVHSSVDFLADQKQPWNKAIQNVRSSLTNYLNGKLKSPEEAELIAAVNEASEAASKPEQTSLSQRLAKVFSKQAINDATLTKNVKKYTTRFARDAMLQQYMGKIPGTLAGLTLNVVEDTFEPHARAAFKTLKQGLGNFKDKWCNFNLGGKTKK